MTEDQIRDLIAAQRHQLADTLSALPEEAWDAPTLCDGWRVREVIAHVAMEFRYPTARFLWHFALAGFNFHRLNNRRATADARDLSSAELTASIRDNVHHPWKPPGTGYASTLTHETVHALDALVPLGVDWSVPEPTVRAVLDAWDVEHGRKYFGVDLTGVRLCADDLDWTVGEGKPLTGHASDLLLVLAGRKLPPARLTGPAAPRFTAQSSS
ncbi:maleylpyruvate isomerase family mycothiol-dependent enzyme [Cryptosporangium sp. NPDC048952]|uniref:maleylpyruvate isomerase family mycothiol-dependent enzyme n=1 Tax=Cryptosporangium sp. NPDC048952 TaxID=3363961 RepID=UPI003719CEDD